VAAAPTVTVYCHDDAVGSAHGGPTEEAQPLCFTCCVVYGASLLFIVVKEQDLFFDEYAAAGIEISALVVVIVGVGNFAGHAAVNAATLFGTTAGPTTRGTAGALFTAIFLA
jgi:hypothetical protein